MLCGCDGTLFHSYRRLGGEWQRDSVVEFTYDAHSSPDVLCGLQVEARTDAPYRYKNLVVCVELSSIGDSLMACDTLPIMVYGDEGHRVGSTAGMLYQQSSKLILPKAFFGDSVVIRLRHLMPDEALEGVHDIGVKLINLRN